MLTFRLLRSPEDLAILIALEEVGADYRIASEPRPAGLGIEAARSPLLTSDRDPRFAIFSPTAALLHFADQSPRLLPRSDADARTAAVQWLGWEAASLGPVRDPGCQYRASGRAAISEDSARQALDLLERRLTRCGFLMDKFGIADIAVWPWASTIVSKGVAARDLRATSRWLTTVRARPAVRRAMDRLEGSQRAGESQRRLVAFASA